MSLRASIHPLLAAALLLTVTGCSKRAPAPASKPVSEAPKPAAKPAPAPVAVAPSAPKVAAKPGPKPAPAPVSEPEPEPTPQILFSLRGIEAGRLANDRPLFVGVRIESSVDKDNALTLAPAGGRWREGVRVELSAPGSPDKILLRAQHVDGAGDTAVATLGAGGAADGTWFFPSAEIGKLAPGDYQVQVKLALTDGPGWHGAAAGEPAAVTVVVAATDASPTQQVRRALALAGEAMLAKDSPKAAQLLDAGLAADPDNVDLLQARGWLCLEGGNIPGANACVGHAWARVMREKWTHPPDELHALSQAVAVAMLQPPANASTPLPPWSMPPAAVLAPLPAPEPPASKK